MTALSSIESHLGMASTFEGMARGVPMLCIPVFADQHRNSHKLKAVGIARVISIEQVANDKLFAELNEMLDNKQYTKKAKEIGRLFNDYLIHPMDEAMFWIEHVINSNGANYLKSKAVKLYWVQYIGLDVWILPVIVVIVLYLLFKLLNTKIGRNRSRKLLGTKQKATKNPKYD